MNATIERLDITPVQKERAQMMWMGVVTECQ
jgi:hypothetical protein